MLPGVASPGIVAGFARGRHRVKLPQLLPCRDIVSSNKSADAIFSTRWSHDNFAFDHERRFCDRITQLRIGDFDIPYDAPIGCVKRNQMSSSVPMNKVLPRIASPRFTRPQHKRTCGETSYRYVQKTRPVRASRATTLFGASVTYMTPSTTIGVASIFWSESAWKTHCISKFFTLVGVI